MTTANHWDISCYSTKEKEIATRYWEIPWAVEPGGLQSWDCKRIRHDLATK